MAPLFHNIRGSPSPPSLSALYSLDGLLPYSLAASPIAIILSKVQTLFLVSLLFCFFWAAKKIWDKVRKESSILLNVDFILEPYQEIQKGLVLTRNPKQSFLFLLLEVDKLLGDSHSSIFVAKIWVPYNISCCAFHVASIGLVFFFLVFFVLNLVSISLNNLYLLCNNIMWRYLVPFLACYNLWIQFEIILAIGITIGL